MSEGVPRGDCLQEPEPLRKFLIVTLATVILALVWQALVVHYNYGGNWTALFCTGSRHKIPPSLASENIYVLPDSSGYDGQFYHYIAHDPFLQEDGNHYIDAPQLRYRRILVPLLAFLLAGGQDSHVDLALYVVFLLFVGLGSYWLSRYAVGLGGSPAWGLAFLLVPAVTLSLERLTVDFALAALTVAFVLYERIGPPWKLYVVLASAILARETGVLLLGGYVLFLLFQRRPLRAAAFFTALLPAVVWYLYVHARIPGDIVQTVTSLPVVRLRIYRIAPLSYNLPPLAEMAVVGLDYLAMLGAPLAVFLSIRAVLKRPLGPTACASFLYASLATWVAASFALRDIYSFPRIVTPLLLLLALRGVSTREWLMVAPLCMMVPRTVVQLGPQMLRVLQNMVS